MIEFFPKGPKGDSGPPGAAGTSIYTGEITFSAGTVNGILPVGWSVSRLGAGSIVIKHNLGFLPGDEYHLRFVGTVITTGSIHDGYITINTSQTDGNNMGIYVWSGTTQTDINFFFHAINIDE